MLGVARFNSYFVTILYLIQLLVYDIKNVKPSGLEEKNYLNYVIQEKARQFITLCY